MGYADAVRDGIKILKSADGFDVFLVPCSVCGRLTENWGYQSNMKYRCFKCRKEKRKCQENPSSLVRGPDATD